MTPFQEQPIPKAPVDEQDGGLLTFDSKKSGGKYINELYHWLHEVAKGQRTTKAECHRCNVDDGEVTLVLLPSKMTGMCTSTGWKIEFCAAVLHESARSGAVTGWIVSTHENAWFNFRCFSEPEPADEPEGEDHG